MVHTQLYCPEQIKIPENLPKILKEYTKAALRTQPYDLLRWSAAYFRCLEMGIAPPVKQHFEKDVKHGSLTKEYLRVLIKQVGKGFFIGRNLLEKRWEGLCLPKEELFKYLSLCRMLNWPQVHWLKVFSVMVGSINPNPVNTMIMICELLTNNVEGAEPFIPMWIFRVCYTFIAELDCSVEQTFIDGRKELPNCTLEDKISMKGIPEICSPDLLRKLVLEECRHKYGGTTSDEDREMNGSKNIDENLKSNMTCESEPFEFVQNGLEIKDINEKCTDFDSIILLLRESQGAKLHEYDGPVRITDRQIRHIKKKQTMINEERERQANQIQEYSKNLVFEQQIRMIQELGPPWTWLHDFTINCTIDKSYNFLDAESIISDITPLQSSDESFDFGKEKPITDIYSDDSEDQKTVISLVHDDSSHEDLDKILLGKIYEKQSDGKEIEKCEILKHLRSSLSEAEIKIGPVSDKTESLIECIRKEAKEVLDRSGEKRQDQVNLLEIADILEVAHSKGVFFNSIDEMIEYIRKMYKISEPPKAPCEEISVDLSHIKNEICEEEEHIEEEEEQTFVTSSDMEHDSLEFQKGEPTQEEVKTEQAQQQIIITSKSTKPQDNDESEDESTENEKGKEQKLAVTEKKELENDKEEPIEKEINLKRNLEDLKEGENMREDFEKCGIEVDQRVVNENLPPADELILGLVPKPEHKEEEIGEEEESTVAFSESEISNLGNIKDDSSLLPSTERSSTSLTTERMEICGSISGTSTSIQEKNIPPDAFKCKIPPLPGIGGPVPKKIIQDFLTYLKGRSRNQNGMVGPRNFKEMNCPRMIDTTKI